MGFGMTTMFMFMVVMLLLPRSCSCDLGYMEHSVLSEIAWNGGPVPVDHPLSALIQLVVKLNSSVFP